MTVKSMGAGHLVDFRNADPISEIMTITDGRDIDSAIEALGMPDDCEAPLRVSRSSARCRHCVCSSDPRISLAAFTAGLRNHKIVTTLCPGGKERMRSPMKMVESERIDARLHVAHGSKSMKTKPRTISSTHWCDGVESGITR